MEFLNINLNSYSKLNWQANFGMSLVSLKIYKLYMVYEWVDLWSDFRVLNSKLEHDCNRWFEEKRVQSHLKFWKFKVALNPRRIFLNFAKSCILSCWLQFDNRKWESPSSFLSYKCSKLKLRVFLAGHIVAMVAYCVTKIIPTCSLVIRQFSDTMIVASIDKKW